MQEQTGVLARRAKKKAAFDSLRDVLASDPGRGVTTASIIADLDVTRGSWPSSEDVSD
jgi:hypothetical protein